MRRLKQTSRDYCASYRRGDASAEAALIIEGVGPPDRHAVEISASRFAARVLGACIAEPFVKPSLLPGWEGATNRRQSRKRHTGIPIALDRSLS